VKKAAVPVAALALAIAGWRAISLQSRVHATTPEQQVRQAVYDSQVFETTTIYGKPKAFNRSQLSKYWVPIEQGGRAVPKIEAAVQRQLKRGVHYGSESKVETFDFIFVKILPPGDYAEVRTRERWYVPVFREDGTRVTDRAPYLGPYEVDYTLRKINGRWLIQSNGTPYSS